MKQKLAIAPISAAALRDNLGCECGFFCPDPRDRGCVDHDGYRFAGSRNGSLPARQAILDYKKESDLPGRSLFLVYRFSRWAEPFFVGFS